VPTHRYPVFVCRGPDGTHTATLVEAPGDAPAVAATAAAAVDQVRQYLRWKLDREPWLEAPDWQDPELSSVRVSVRPEYEQGGRRHPCPEPVDLTVWMVKGQDKTGLRLCSMPTLGVAFTYADADALKGLATYYAQTVLRGLTPRALSRLLPPADPVVEEVAVRVDPDKAYKAPPPELESLRATADPIGDRGFARRVSRPWERDADLDALAKLLVTEPVSVLLVGESGSGKTSLLIEAARRIEREKTSPNPEATTIDGDGLPSRRRFWLTNAGRLIAGMKYLGQWEERVEGVIAELTEIDGWLCAENLLDLVTTGGSGPQDSLAAFLAPYVERREVRLIAEATPADLDACRRLLPGLVERMRIVRVPPMSRGQAIAALQKVADQHARNLKLEVAGGTVETIHRLHARFLPYQAFPGAASGFVVSLLDHAHREQGRRKGQAVPAAGRPPGVVAPSRVTPADAVERFVKLTGLPELFVRDELPLDADAVAAHLRARVIAQDEACAAAADVVTTFKAGMNDPNRPIGVLLFCGPTGVGKTELARATADYLFGHGEQRDRMIRLDMSEYAGRGAADRLLTDSAGGPSELVRRVRQQPFNLLLLDEVEKAAPEVFDVLLGLFDEGRLTDRNGRLTTFRSCVVVMTSNLGSESAEPFGLVPKGEAADKAAADAVTAAVGEFFRPEFLNRVDAVIPFRPLGPTAVRTIAEKELRDLSKREGLAKANLTLAWTPAVVDLLAATGYDKRYGARPLQRAVEQAVVTPLARFLVDRRELRDATVMMGVGADGRVTFS
jgi:ATP-dependent Clp protease ATP-binding subunit ClpC